MLLPGFKAAGRNSGADRHLPGSRQQTCAWIADHRKTLSKRHMRIFLSAHSNGQWAKKNRGRIHCLGVSVPADVLRQKYQAVRGDLQAGRGPCAEVLAGRVAFDSYADRVAGSTPGRASAGRHVVRSYLVLSRNQSPPAQADVVLLLGSHR